VTDTSPEVSAEFDALMAQRSGSDRVRMASEMFDLARRLAAADITLQHPGLSEGRLRALLFERLYGDDFPPEDRVRIMAWLAGETR
jgi:hypothetical protein